MQYEYILTFVQYEETVPIPGTIVQKNKAICYKFSERESECNKICIYIHLTIHLTVN